MISGSHMGFQRVSMAFQSTLGIFRRLLGDIRRFREDSAGFRGSQEDLVSTIRRNLICRIVEVLISIVYGLAISTAPVLVQIT